MQENLNSQQHFSIKSIYECFLSFCYTDIFNQTWNFRNLGENTSIFITLKLDLSVTLPAFRSICMCRMHFSWPKVLIYTSSHIKKDSHSQSLLLIETMKSLWCSIIYAVRWFALFVHLCPASNGRRHHKSSFFHSQILISREFIRFISQQIFRRLEKYVKRANITTHTHKKNFIVEMNRL